VIASPALPTSIIHSSSVLAKQFSDKSTAASEIIYAFHYHMGLLSPPENVGVFVVARVST
jgi:hypothetical protein